MTEIHPVRVVTVEGVAAVAFARAPQEHMTVADAEAADRALSDPGNTQHCGLCNQFYGTVAFVSHVRGCADAYAARYERQRDREPFWKRRGKRVIVPGHSLNG